MPRKPKQGRQRVDDAAQRVRSLDPQSLYRRTEYWVLYVLGTVAFLLVAAILAVAAATGSWWMAGIASVFLFVWVAATVRPHLESLEAFGRWLWSRESADRIHDTLCSVLPWRDKRGSSRTQTILALGLVVVLVASTLGAAVPASATTGSSTSPSAAACSTAVVHDWPQSNATVSEFNNSSSVSQVVDNTKVEIENTDAFYRVRAENPNAYCVKYTVRIHEDIIPPTELGTVDSVNGTTTAEWHDVTEFDTQRTYTEIQFTLAGGQSAMLAPSEPEVLVPAWRDNQKRKAGGILGSIREKLSFESPFDDDTADLETKTYEFSKPNDSDYVTVKLDNETTNQSISEWHALARPTDEEEIPRNPVSQDSSAPVFYRMVDGGSKVQFVFNNPNVTVKFVANPEAGDDFSYEMTSLKRSFYELRQKISFLTITPNPDRLLGFVESAGASLALAPAVRRLHS